MNNKFLPIGVFLSLMVTSLFAGHQSYMTTRNEIEADLSQALSMTIKEKEDNFVSPDTIKAYKQLRTASDGHVLIAVSDKRFCKHLKNSRLKNNAFITFDIVDKQYKGGRTDEHMICSDTLIIEDKNAGATLALRGYTRLSASTIFGLSDQRMSSTLAAMAFAWALLSWLYMRKKAERLCHQVEFGGITYSDCDNCFYDSNHNPIHFTPMQLQLMMMFWNAPAHSLSKERICTELWPKKDDANDTLYTLIKRLRPIVENNSNLEIATDRGRQYSLKIKE